jgi:murein DD-endopeptidase MepM/ murein hydrolase activator NlpD
MERLGMTDCPFGVERTGGSVHSGRCAVFLVRLVVLALLLFAALDPQTVQAADAPGGEIRQGATELEEGLWVGLFWPLSGVESSPFGMRTHPVDQVVRAHGGIDIAAPRGSSVVSALAGRVARVGNGKEIGLYVVLVHANGLETLYGHLSKRRVEPGDFVRPRQEIGLVGDTGNATGPHLHFALKRDGVFVDPKKWLIPRAFARP